MLEAVGGMGVFGSTEREKRWWYCEHRMVWRDFNVASVILCHESIGAVAYVRRSGCLKVVPERSRAWVRLSAILTDWCLWPQIQRFLRMSDDFFL